MPPERPKERVGDLVNGGEGTQLKKSVIVIGGGVAGIAASVALAEAGLEVLLLEKRPLLGGRASSFVDAKTGERVDECQHGTMRCCTNLMHLLERLGVAEKIVFYNRLEFLDGEGRRSAIYGSNLPAPLHTFPSFLSFRSLSWRDKTGIARALWAMLRADLADPQWEQKAIAQWLRNRGQTEVAIRQFWRPILVSACNEELERISCACAFFLFRQGFLMHPEGFHFGLPRVPLASLYTEPTRDYLAKRGGCVRTRTSVHQIEVEEGRVLGIKLASGEQLRADWYVLAVQCDLLPKLLPASIFQKEPTWQQATCIPLSPLLGAHFWFDRPLSCPPALAILDRRIEWIFHRSQNLGASPTANSCLSVVISASRPYEEMDKEQLKNLLLKDLFACLPEAAQAQLTHWTLVRWPKATIAPAPGVEALRPSQTTSVFNLVLAGEWTHTGWPSTMEGAARSGYLAARAILEREGLPCSVPVPDLPASGFAKWLLRRSS